MFGVAKGTDSRIHMPVNLVMLNLKPMWCCEANWMACCLWRKIYFEWGLIVSTVASKGLKTVHFCLLASNKCRSKQRHFSTIRWIYSCLMIKRIHQKSKGLSQFSISYLEAQVISNFSSKSLDHFLSSHLATWKPSHMAKSQATSVADLEISWAALTSSFVFCIFSNSYIWHYMVCFTIYIQKAVRNLFIDKLCVRCHRPWQHRMLFTSAWVAMVLHPVTSLYCWCMMSQ